MKQHQCRRGFTLVEIIVAIAIIAILGAIAAPSYSSYIRRSRIPPGLDALNAYGARMEQAYQDSGRYNTGAACTPTLPVAANFTFTCAITNGGQGFIATATGTGPVVGHAYSLDNTGRRRTVAHPKGVPAADCWSMRGQECDDR